MGEKHNQNIAHGKMFNKTMGRGHFCPDGLENVFLRNQLKHCVCIGECGCHWDIEDLLGNSTLKTQKMNNLEIGNGCH